jgi:hypothetical protein
VNPPVFHVDTAFAQGLRDLFTQLETRLSLRHPLTAYLAGGMAVHLYTGKRSTNDVDAELSARVLIPNDLVVEVIDDNGDPQAVYFDTNYNPMFALLHEDYQQDSVEVSMGLEHIVLRVLSPVDLAVSKLARFAANDREDIRDLVRLGLTNAAEIDARATEALAAYIGDHTALKYNLRDAMAIALDAERSSKASRASPKSRGLEP